MFSESDGKVFNKHVGLTFDFLFTVALFLFHIAGVLPGKHRRKMCIRIYYRSCDTSVKPHKTEVGYFHTFCSTGTRLFNNIVITIRNEDEARGELRYYYF